MEMESDMSAATLDFASIWRSMLSSKRLFAISTAACVLGGIALALFLPPKYTATVLLSPSENDAPGGGLAALAGQFAGIADLAGMQLRGNVNSDEAMAILASREFTEQFIDKHGLLPILFKEDWDSKKGAWKASAGGNGIMQSFSRWVARLTGDRAAASGDVSSDGGPSLWQGFRRFDSLRHIDKDRKTQMVRVSVAWRDPRIAAQWANDLVDELNRHTRDRAIRESARNREFLEGELAKTNVVAMQGTLYRLVESELKKAMVAAVREEYAFRVLGRALPPMQRTSPKRTQIVIASFAVGVIIAFCVAVVRARRLQPAS
jgi:uncharacterized protein involved in exopolysaccharide biosynthesis